MAANSFKEIIRSLRLYVPQLPITLAEQFIRDRYRRILERRDWSALRRESEFQLNAQKSDGTVALTRGLATVTGTTTSFASSDVGRQFKAGTNSPIYTIITFGSPTSITLDRPFGGATGSGLSYRIFDGYVTPPTDFLRFISVVDPGQGWKLRHWTTASELNAMDPQRNFFGQPYLLADRLFNVATAGSADPQPQYEVWPFTTTARTLYFTYIRRGADLINDNDIPIWPVRSDAIVAGALADVARWPGVMNNPNPYFTRPDFWKAYELEYEDKMLEIERRDEDVYVSMLQQWPFTDYTHVAPVSANWLQSHVI